MAKTEKVKSKVKFEISQIEQLFEEYQGLLEKIQQKKPDSIETAAIATILHSFYNGIENIFLSIAKAIDGNVPTVEQWHRNLLLSMTESTSERPAVISTETSHDLIEYLAFRHFFRHSYSFHLDWEKLEKLTISLNQTWEEIKKEFQNFLLSL